MNPSDGAGRSCEIKSSALSPNGSNASPRRKTWSGIDHHRNHRHVQRTRIANAIKAGSAKPEDAVAPPWTPKLKRISADFSAVAEVRLGLYDRGNAIDRLFHVHPFGIEEARAPGAEGWPLLPDYDEEGALYLGLLDVEAPQSLCLLFAGAEGGGAEEHAGALKWSYLDADGWAEFAEPPADSTGGLVKRGIVRFELPAAAPDSRMPSGFYWLRASMATGAANACDMIDVHAQAGSASFVDADAPPEHYDAPLPAKTIRAFADPAAGIARVIQPYPSSGGCPGEGPEGFRTRVAERLRHCRRHRSERHVQRLPGCVCATPGASRADTQYQRHASLSRHANAASRFRGKGWC